MIEVSQNSTMITSLTETSATTSKKRGVGRRYYCTNSCENLEEAINLMKDEKIWTVKNKTINTIYYRCNLQSRRSKIYQEKNYLIKHLY